MASFIVRALRGAVTLALVFLSLSAFATSFIVPSDEEFVRKSDAIVRGIVVSHEVVEDETGFIETVYEIALTRVFKGAFAEGGFVTVRSAGGGIGERFVLVDSAAHFRDNEDVLLFLSNERGRWLTTDMTLGKFRPAVTTKGYSVLVRDSEDIVGWGRDGKPHVEKVRLEHEFQRFIEDTVRGRHAIEPYEADTREVIAPPPPPEAGGWRPESLSVFPAHSYSSRFIACDNTQYPGRWSTATMNAGLSYRKNSAQNLGGVGDGGVAAIQAGLAAWTDDCESAVNITYGGTTAATAISSNDSNYIVLFNDPFGHIGGSWTGAGTIATAFSYALGSHTHDGTLFLTLVDGDIVFQNGYTASEPSLEEAMTHEIGHTIGIRHSNQSFVKNCTITPSGESCTLSACSAPACDAGTMDCSNSAIMNSSAISSLGYVLQAWDKNAVNALYPAAACSSAPAPPTNVQAIKSTGSTVLVSWSGSDGATSYSVWRSSGGEFAQIGVPDPAAATSFLDVTAAANTGYAYRVKAHNAGGDSDFSGMDIALTMIYTDPTVSSGMVAKAAHLTELRTAAQLMIGLTGGGAIPWTDPSITNAIRIKAVHFQEVEEMLLSARAILGLSVVPSMSIDSGEPILASHITALRSYVP